MITLISAGRNRIIVIRRQLPRTEDAGGVLKPYRTKDRRILLSVSHVPVTRHSIKPKLRFLICLLAQFLSHFSNFLLNHASSKAPWLHRRYPASSLIWASPTPCRATPAIMYFRGALVACASTRQGLPGSSADLSTRAVPNRPGRSDGCLHLLLHHRSCLASS